MPYCKRWSKIRSITYIVPWTASSLIDCSGFLTIFFLLRSGIMQRVLFPNWFHTQFIRVPLILIRTNPIAQHGHSRSIVYNSNIHTVHQECIALRWVCCIIYRAPIYAINTKSHDNSVITLALGGTIKVDRSEGAHQRPGLAICAIMIVWRTPVYREVHRVFKDWTLEIDSPNVFRLMCGVMKFVIRNIVCL